LIRSGNNSHSSAQLSQRHAQVFYWHDPRLGVTELVESKRLCKNTESLPHWQMCVCVGDTNPKVTKHSDCFVWKDKSEVWLDAVTAPIDREWGNSCVLKHLFVLDHLWRVCDEPQDTIWDQGWRDSTFEGVLQQKKFPKNPGNALCDTRLVSGFQNFAASAAPKKRACVVFYKGHFSRFNWLLIKVLGSQGELMVGTFSPRMQTSRISHPVKYIDADANLYLPATHS